MLDRLRKPGAQRPRWRTVDVTPVSMMKRIAKLGDSRPSRRGKGLRMADVHDVAAAIVEKHGPMTAMKLQKLVYYSQAWHLVWEEEPLFGNEVEAWANGPVVRELYNRHRGQFRVQDWRHGDKRRLNRRELSTIRAVLDFYGEKSAAWLSELSHREDPWRDARAAAGLEAGERGNATIPLGSMAEYYSGLVGATDA